MRVQNKSVFFVKRIFSIHVLFKMNYFIQKFNKFNGTPAWTIEYST